MDLVQYIKYAHMNTETKRKKKKSLIDLGLFEIKFKIKSMFLEADSLFQIQQSLFLQ